MHTNYSLYLCSVSIKMKTKEIKFGIFKMLSSDKQLYLLLVKNNFELASYLKSHLRVCPETALHRFFHKRTQQ